MILYYFLRIHNIVTKKNIMINNNTDNTDRYKNYNYLT